MSYIYNFPKFKHIPHDGVERLQQGVHIMSEAREAMDEARLDWSNDFDNPSIKYAVELMDVIHAAETALRGLDESLVDEAKHRCILKNAKRFYYASDDLG